MLDESCMTKNIAYFPSSSLSEFQSPTYNCFVFGEYGSLGLCNRIRILECVVAFICAICPDPNNQYTGHRDGDGDGFDAHNESFESVNPDTSGANINFVGREGVKVCVTFKNTQFFIDKVRSFIAQSPVEGWNVTFPSSDFTDATFICYLEEI